jgi:hypothetical protein
VNYVVRKKHDGMTDHQMKNKIKIRNEKCTNTYHVMLQASRFTNIILLHNTGNLIVHLLKLGY